MLFISHHLGGFMVDSSADALGGQMFFISWLDLQALD